MYLVGIIDAYSRYIVGWSLSNTMTTRWCRECLEEAIMRHGAPEILSTDQGSQFSSSEFSGYFTTHPAIKFSMDGKGSAIDNIFIERFWRSLKYEKIYLEPSDNGLELYHKIKDYMKFYNMERPHQGPDYKRPVTNIHIRRQIKESSLTNFQLAQPFRSSPTTINQWKNKETATIKAHALKRSYML